MAHKSKTQRAKASAARSARKAEREEMTSTDQQTQERVETSAEKPKKSIFKKSKQDVRTQTPDVLVPKNSESTEPKKSRLSFFKDVKSELKRVTWPTKADVLQWSVVVVVALIFFGIYVGVLDNAIITPLLFAISGLGA